MSYLLTVLEADIRGRVAWQEWCHGETPRVDDLLTFTAEALVARVTGVGRVLKPVADPPDTPASNALQESAIVVTAKAEA